MKKLLSILLVAMAVSALCIPAFAADDAREEAYTIIVNGQTIDLDDLPVSPYKEGTTVMVPLRKIGETLGYKVDWDSEIKAITVDDEYIQKATLFNKTATVIFEGKLQIIDMSREVENKVPTIVHDGYTYVPLEFFQEFFNDTVIDETTITITPSKSELCTGI